MYKKLALFFLLISFLNNVVAQEHSIESRYYNAFDKAVASFNIMNYDEALMHLTECKKIIPDKISAYLFSAEILIAKKAYEQALDELKLAYTIDSNDYRVFYNKAICLTKLAKFKEAVDVYTFIINNISKEPLFYVERANVYNLIKNKKQACLDFRTALYNGSVTARDSIDKYCKGKF